MLGNILMLIYTLIGYLGFIAFMVLMYGGIAYVLIYGLQ